MRLEQVGWPLQSKIWHLLMVGKGKVVVATQNRVLLEVENRLGGH